MAPLPLIPPPLQNSSFTLDIFSIAGFFGGDEVIQAMATLHLYKGRKWRGWYNSPGTYAVAKSFGRMANSRFWRGLFPGTTQDPATAFGMDGKKGPKYLGALSGTEITTGHTGYLLAEYVKSLNGLDLRDEGHRITKATSVTVIDVRSVENLDNLSAPSSLLHLLLSYFTMISSIACAVFSLILFDDKVCFAAILLGTLIGGISSIIIGFGDLSLQSVFSPAPGSPPGDGVLVGEEIVVVRGTEANVNAITKGKFHLKLIGSPKYHIIGVCSMLYFLQFITQLFLIPQGSLPGQLMFLTSFAIAWVNNCALASIDKEAIQMDVLAQSVKMDIKKYKLPSRTMATLFTCLALHRSPEELATSPEYGDFDPERLLKYMLPNNTTVWQAWRQVVMDVLQSKQPPEYFDTAVNGPKLSGLRSDQKSLLKTLLNDAGVTYKKYYELMQIESRMKESIDTKTSKRRISWLSSHEK
ncbi:hypothetical protein GALMADRAFT_211824 [Galerina marginata CBS 339.88]|uniref:Uncharacterized protein n=1 Tax=Galerina marginata (strain CBS 339.88) TaxID=685588 RepID=A0A067SVQ7_GALM3|nr:hypothetical protein GALMADRAFT_211824 [Galerina marginata CBS 339.88]